MLKSALLFALVLVGCHLLFGISLAIVEATHGIDDQDASFLLAVVFYQLNRPAAWLLTLFGLPTSTFPVILVGVLQWSALALPIALVHQKLQTRGSVGEDRGEQV
jgi:hypothetical protein